MAKPVPELRPGGYTSGLTPGRARVVVAGVPLGKRVDADEAVALMRAASLEPLVAFTSAMNPGPAVAWTATRRQPRAPGRLSPTDGAVFDDCMPFGGMPGWRPLW